MRGQPPSSVGQPGGIRMTTLIKLSLGALCLLATAGAHAQNTAGDYPNRSIRIIVTGGTFDKRYDELTGRLSYRLSKDRKSTRLNSSHQSTSRMPSSA